MSAFRVPVPRRPSRTAVLLTVAALGAALLAVVLPVSRAAATGSTCGTGVNPIACENRLPGTAKSVWDVSGAGDPDLQGFTTDISVNAGNSISFKIKTIATNYKIDIYRLGYYGGNGAALKAANLSHVAPVAQPTCYSDSTTGLYDCGNWSVSATWAVPSTAVSGVYLARLTRTDPGSDPADDASQIPFVVRNDSSTSDIVYQTSDPTWQAYNRYGGSDFYTGDQSMLFDSPSRARKLSYNRPFATRGDNSGRDYLFSDEYPTIKFMEQNGYDVTYISGVDTDRYGATLLQHHKVFMSVGHDEYWSAAQRANVTAARNAGVNLMFLSGNEVFWHTRYEPSIDGTNTAYRTLVCYKETWDGAATDPTGEATATWRDPRFSTAPGGTNPENSLTGTMYKANVADLAITVTAAQGKQRLWRNTGLASMAGASTALAAHTIGYESDEDLDNGYRPAGEIDSSTTVGPSPGELTDFGQYTASGTTTHHLTMYRAAGGALVFGAGTIQFGWGLNADHDGTAGAADVRMQQMTVNVLADMGTRPTTLMSGLVAATASTDHTAPTSTITSPAAGAAIANGTSVTVTGTASDVGGIVAGVEVSIDGGSTWHPATGTTSWSYTGVIHGTPSTKILSRATDDSLNTGTPSAGVTVATSCPCSLFGTTVPANADSGDASAVEVGTRFTADTDGYVTGVRFYKASTNTGTHLGTLWTASGRQLATGTFTGETASGWQSLTFTTPVAITANTTYVVSYYAPSGHYAEDDRFFYYHSYDSSPLHAEATSIDGSTYNSVFVRGHKFPSGAYLGANYWVDVNFTTSAPAGPRVTSISPSSGATSVPASSDPTATFSTAMTASSVTATMSAGSTSVTGNAAYNTSTNTVTFTPSAALAPSTTYTVSVAGADSGGTPIASPYTWQFTTAAGTATCPCSLFPAGTVPSSAGIDSGDRTAVSVGVQFSPSVSGYVTGVRFYKSAANTGSHTGSLWSSGGTRLATGTFSAETASGWQSLTFGSPVAVTAGSTYTASYYAPAGHYSEDDHYFDAAVTNGPLTAPVGAGTYGYGGDVNPTSAYANANYWVDPIFSTDGTPPPTPPTVASTTPVAGATNASPASNPSAVFSTAMTASSVTMTLTTASTTVAGSSAYAASTGTVTFTPSTPLTANTAYTATVNGTNSSGTPMSAPYTWSFTTAAACPCSLFPAGAAPATSEADSGDRYALSVGVKFTPTEAGFISGVRFYKAGTNTGTHTGSLWSAGGAQLATGTFSAETASGWQTLTFAAPVAVTAGTSYEVSYYAPAGHYSETDQYFASGMTNGPVSAPAAAGVYAYGSDTFPTSTYANANYWVDPVFTRS